MQGTRPGVPNELPPVKLQMVLPGITHIVGFDFPDVPGIPRFRERLTQRFRTVRNGLGDRGAMPQDEWEASLATLAYEYDRADYHLERFWDCLEVLKARRALLGGPMVGDPGPARGLYCEAAGYLSAIRTTVDLYVYVAARRAGETVEKAENWKAHRIITGKPANLGDLKILQAHKAWFETLNAYRNVISHRGWHDRVPGYLSKGDTAPEATHPFRNVMLMPDLAPLMQHARPHAWTYNDNVWLDEVIKSVSDESEKLVLEIMAEWKVPDPPPGKIPQKEHPTVYLYVPQVPVLKMGAALPECPVFLSKKAARDYVEDVRKRGYRPSSTGLRAIRRTKWQEGEAFLLAYDPELVGGKAELQAYESVGGILRVFATHVFAPGDNISNLENTIRFMLPGFDGEVIYVYA